MTDFKIEVHIRFPAAGETKAVDITPFRNSKDFLEEIAFEYDEPKYRYFDVVRVPDNLEWAMKHREPDTWAWDYIYKINGRRITAEVAEAAFRLNIRPYDIHSFYIGEEVREYEGHLFIKEQQC